jgi:hypothetical protein
MPDLNSSPNTWAAITPSDTVDIPGQKNNKAPSRIYAAGAGNITMLDASGTSALFVFAAAQTRELSPTRIMSTGTTATGIIGLW